MAVAIDSTVTPTGGWFTTGSTETISPVSWDSGDYIVVIAMTEDTGVTFTGISNANLSFSLISGAALTTGGSECWIQCWYAQAGSTQTSQTITLTKSSSGSTGGGYAFVVSGSTAPTGGANSRTESAMSINPPTGALVIWACADWSANNSNQTPTTNTGTSTEHQDLTDTSRYAVNINSWLGVTTGTDSYGVTSYTGIKASQVIFWLPASGSSPTTMNPAVTDIAVSIQTVTITKGARALAPATTNITYSIQSVTMTKGGRTLAPATNDIAYVINTPTVVKTKTMAPAATDVVFTINTPTLTKGARTLSPATTDVAVTINTPVFSQGKNLTPATTDVTFTINTPTLVKGARTLSPTTQDITTTINTPTVVKTKAMAPATTNISYVINTPTVVKGGRTLAPAATDVTYVINTPAVVKGGRALAPATQNITFTINDPGFTVSGQDNLNPTTTNITFTINTPTLVKGARTLAPATTNIAVTLNLAVMTIGSGMAVVEHDVVFRQVEATEAFIDYGTADSAATDQLNGTLAELDGWWAYYLVVMHGNHVLTGPTPGTWTTIASVTTGAQNTEVKFSLHEMQIVASAGDNVWRVQKNVAAFKWYAFLLVTSERLTAVGASNSTEVASSLSLDPPAGSGDWQSWLFAGKNSTTTEATLEKSTANNFATVASIHDTSSSSVRLGGIIAAQTIAGTLGAHSITSNPATVMDIAGIQLAFQGDTFEGNANALVAAGGDVDIITAALPVVSVVESEFVHRMQQKLIVATSSDITDWSLTGSPPSWVTLGSETSTSATITLNRPARTVTPGEYVITLRATNVSGNTDTPITITVLRPKGYALTGSRVDPIITPTPEIENLPFSGIGNALVTAQGAVNIISESTNATWRAMVHRSQQELDLSDGVNGFPGGHFMFYGGPLEQVWHTTIRHPEDSDVLAGTHDVGTVAISLNGGRAWRYLPSDGKLSTGCPGGICFDPDSYALYALSGGRGIEAEYDDEGLYYYPDVRDFTLSWQFIGEYHVDERLGTAGDGGISSVNPRASSRWGQDTFIHDPHVDNRYYMMVDSHGLYRMTGTGTSVTITKIWNTIGLSTVRDTYRLLMHPTISDTLFICCRGAGANAGKVWRLTNLGAGTATATDISSGLPAFGATPDGDTSYGCLWIDFINPLNPAAAGNAMIASCNNRGLYHTTNAMATTPAWTAWSGAGGNDPEISRVFINPYNINRWVYLNEEGEAPFQQYSNDAGVTRSTATVVVANWPHFNDSNWKTTTGGRYSVVSFNPDVPGEAFHHNKAANFMTRDHGQTWYPATDYMDGWNNGGSGHTRWDWHSNDIVCAAYHDHGAAITVNNGRSWTHLVTPDGAGLGKNTCNAIAKAPGSNAMVCGSGDHGDQQLCYTPNYLTTPFVLVDQPIKKYQHIYYYDADVVHAGHIRSFNRGSTWNSLGNSILSSNCELIDHCINDPEVMWYFRWYGTTNNKREIFRVLINPANPSGALTVTSYLIKSTGGALSGDYFACDHNNRNIIYVVSGLDLFRWNGTSLTNLGVSSIPELSGIPAGTVLGSIATDPEDSNVMIISLDRSGIPWLFRTENLLSATPSWEDITDNRTWGNMSLGIRPQTGETFLGTPQGPWLYPRSASDARSAEQMYDATGVDMTTTDFTYKAPIQP